MFGKTEKSSDVCRTASLSELGHGQRAATSSTVTDQRWNNFFVRKSSYVTEVPPNRRVLPMGDDFGCSGGRNRVAHHCKVDWCLLVKKLENQQTDLVLQALLNGQPVQSISMSLMMWSFFRLCSISRAAPFSTFCSGWI